MTRFTRAVRSLASQPLMSAEPHRRSAIQSAARRVLTMWKLLPPYLVPPPTLGSEGLLLHLKSLLSSAPPATVPTLLTYLGSLAYACDLMGLHSAATQLRVLLRQPSTRRRATDLPVASKSLWPSLRLLLNEGPERVLHMVLSNLALCPWTFPLRPGLLPEMAAVHALLRWTACRGADLLAARMRDIAVEDHQGEQWLAVILSRERTYHQGVRLGGFKTDRLRATYTVTVPMHVLRAVHLPTPDTTTNAKSLFPPLFRIAVKTSSSMWEAFRNVHLQLLPTVPIHLREQWTALVSHHEQWRRLRAMELTQLLTEKSLSRYLQVSMATDSYMKGLRTRAHDLPPLPADPALNQA